MYASEKWKKQAFLTFNSTAAGSTIGRNDKECGQIGVRTTPDTLGWTKDAPVDIE